MCLCVWAGEEEEERGRQTRSQTICGFHLGHMQILILGMGQPPALAGEYVGSPVERPFSREETKASSQRRKPPFIRDYLKCKWIRLLKT